MSSLENRNKYLPCIVHSNKKRKAFEIFIFPNRNVLVNSIRTTLPFFKTGYTTKRATDIDLTDPGTPYYKASLELIPRKTNAVADDNEENFTEDENNNNNTSTTSFTTTLTIPIQTQSVNNLST